MVIGSNELQDPAYRATLLYFYVVTHEVMRDTHNIYVEQLAAPRLKQLHLVGRFVGTVGKKWSEISATLLSRCCINAT